MPLSPSPNPAPLPSPLPGPHPPPGRSRPDLARSRRRQPLPARRWRRQRTRALGRNPPSVRRIAPVRARLRGDLLSLPDAFFSSLDRFLHSSCPISPLVMDSSEYGGRICWGSHREAICLDNDGEGEAIYASSDGRGVGKHGESSNDPRCDDVTKELLGTVVHSEEEAYILCCDYGHRMGFSVRRGKQYYWLGTKNVRSKDYYCSKEGFKNDEYPNESSYNKLDTRTGCKAMIRFTVDEDGQWKVTKLVDEHNHDLAKPEERHLLRSMRSTGAKGSVLDPMVNAGIRTINAYSYMVEEGGGAENLAGDLQSLVSHFKRRANQEGMFYWDMQLDQEGRACNFFWRDGRSRVDYDCFGDVVVFNTTYRTNRYNRICVPFIGVNHHWQNVIFGCAFLLDETASSFIWLFKSFLKSMGDQPPKTIFTDQNQAITNAITEVFPNTRHRLCLWHIYKNAPSYLGNLNFDQNFHKLFNKCLQGCDSEEEFEETWGKMISKYNVQDHEWLNNLYKIRQKWCTALNKDTFDGGIKSSQRSESTNNVLHGIADKSTSLIKFVVAFEKLVNGWRKNESEEDFRCNQGAPTRIIKHSEILKHASKMFTHKIYKLFEKEYLDGCGATSSSQEISLGDTLYKFELTMQGRGSKVWTVTLDTSTMEVSCSCRKFETMGLLCSHALKAFNIKNVQRIPERYILKRWTKDAKKRVYSFDEEGSSKKKCTEAELTYHNQAMRYAYNLVMKSQGYEGARKILWDTFDLANAELEKFFAKLSVDAHSTVKDNQANDNDKEAEMVDDDDDDDDEYPMLDPTSVRTEGRSTKRLNEHSEKQKKGSSRREKRKAMENTTKDGSQRLRCLFPAPPSHFPFANPFASSNFYQVQPTNLGSTSNFYMHSYTLPMPSQSSKVTWGMHGSNIPFTSVVQGVNFANNPNQDMSSHARKHRSETSQPPVGKSAASREETDTEHQRGTSSREA
ncbi:protein FAR1-RELATED SEQUENCE 5 isoform X1 [Elaeis guineensis]|uniref:protein FAR1-RELATED SEQUENCE 5 isoform X1 n=1 Tax=Elaeis guineensis var. tenera TaxID=51953 RepID=UPI003C6DA9F3